MTTKWAETVYEFGVHPRLIQDTILKQGGSLEKAILEGIMNAIDAGAKSVAVRISDEYVVITDDGQGLPQSEQAFKEAFMMLGSPQTVESKKYGHYRLGRGQLFAYGKVDWFTDSRCIEIDLQQKFAATISQVEEPREAGCLIMIQLYEQLADWQVTSARRDVIHRCRFVEDCEIRVDGQLANSRPEPGFFEDRGRYRVHRLPITDTQGISVFNRGIYVTTLAASEYGFSALIDTRDTLQLNIARNEALSSCPVWAGLRDLCSEISQGVMSRVDNIRTSAQRQKLVDLLRQGKISSVAVLNVPLIPVVGETLLDVKSLSKHACGCIALGGEDHLADSVHQYHKAAVVTRQALQMFEVQSLDEFVKRLNELFPTAPYRFSLWRLGQDITAEQLESLAQQRRLSGEADLTPAVKRLLKKLNQVVFRLENWMQASPLLPDDVRGLPISRMILAGRDDSPDMAWTDGTSFVAIRLSLLQQYSPKAPWTLVQLVNLLMHELAHTRGTLSENAHSPEFYKRCEILTTHVAPQFTRYFFEKF